MRSRWLMVLPFALARVLTAQSSRTVEAPTPVMLEFEMFADLYGTRLVAAFDSIPAGRYAFRPTPVEQSVGYIAQHLEDANYTLCGRFGGVQHPRTAKDELPDTVKARWPKDTLVARLRASARFCDRALDRVTPASMANVTGSLLAYETDQAEHYSQISVYMRLLGLVPPSALTRVFPPVVAVDHATLQGDTGTYALAKGLGLVVTLRDSALWIRSTNAGAAVRLWPSSPTEFFIREIDAEVSFRRGEDGRVSGLTFREYGRDHPAVRVP